MPKTFFISTSIPYVNANPHIGHALEFVQADVLARYRRQRGEDVFFLTGTDDNALKNVQAAEAAHVPVEEWVDEHAEVFKKLARELNISNDDFIRTSKEKRHILGAQKLWLSCKKEDIYKKKYRGLYCVGCEVFKTEKELVKGECPEHPGKKLEEVEEENYFFRLSKYQSELENLIESNKFKIIPESRRNETLQFIKSGLQDFSISRSRERAKNWGVEVPSDPSQIMYVWVDALSNYINALGYAENDEKFKKYWEKGGEIVHVIGKDIIRFHTLYWPAMLLSAGVRLPGTVFAHGFLTVEGQKMSKTIGNVVNPLEVVQKYGTEPTRYYLLREVSPYEDGDFSIRKFEERYNADLANGLGNFTARVLTLAADANIRINANDAKLENVVDEKIQETRKLVYQKLEEFKFNEALAAIWDLISFGDAYVNDKKPWDTAIVKDQRSKIILNLVIILDNVAALLKPFLPETAEKITSAIAWEGDSLRAKKIGSLFPRL